jgi:repressor LexA
MEGMQDLTERQRGVLNFIIEYQQHHGIAPTVREIGAKVGLRSPATIHRILTLLIDRGYILADAQKKRSWRYSGSLSVGGIPLVGAIAAGDPLEAIERREEDLAISPALFGCDNCFGLHVVGDSMIEAHIMDGDVAIIRPQQMVENGEIAAVAVQGLMTEATLKIVRRYRQTLTLEPANAAYEPMVFKGARRGLVSIIGKYVGIVRMA